MSSRPKTRTPAQFESPKHASDSANLALPQSDLDVLMASCLRVCDLRCLHLDVDVIGLIECLVSPGWRLSFGSVDAPAIHKMSAIVELLSPYLRSALSALPGLPLRLMDRDRSGRWC